MKLKEWKKQLARIEKEFGDDIEVIFSGDDEGNHFQKVHLPPSPGKFKIHNPGFHGSGEFIPFQYEEFVDEKDYEGLKNEISDFKLEDWIITDKKEVNCICLN